MRHTTGSKRHGRAVRIEALEERQMFAAPAAAYTAVTGATNAAGNTYLFNVIYTPMGSPVNQTSIDDFDTLITGPSGTRRGIAVSATVNGNGSVTAQYSVPPPPMPGKVYGC